jgi:hypothetical protein
MKNDNIKRLELRLHRDTYARLLKLNSLRLSTENANISVNKTISDLIEAAFKKAIG